MLTSLRSYKQAVSNYRSNGMVSKLPSVERQFFNKSLYNTRSFEKGMITSTYLRLGGGEPTKRLIQLHGDYLLMIRLLDNVIDGHIYGNPLDPEAAYKLLTAASDVMSNKELDVDVLTNDVDRIGVHSAMIMARKVAKYTTSFHINGNMIDAFLNDYNNLVAGWVMDREIGSIDEYEEIILKTGGTFGLTLLDLSAIYNGFDMEKMGEARDFIFNLNTMVQLIDNQHDNDVPFANQRMRDLRLKYHRHANEFLHLSGSKTLLKLANLYPIMESITDNNFYKCLRYIFA